MGNKLLPGSLVGHARTRTSPVAFGKRRPQLSPRAGAASFNSVAAAQKIAPHRCERPKLVLERLLLDRLLLEEADNDQEDHRANDGVDDRGQIASDQDKPDHRQQPAGDHGADDADHDVADQAEAIALDDLPGQPACDRADDQPDDERIQSRPSSPLLSAAVSRGRCPRSQHVQEAARKQDALGGQRQRCRFAR